MAFAIGAPGFSGTYNVNAAPTSGQGAYGKVPGQIGLPPSLYQQALTNVPGLSLNASTASGDVQNLLSGNLSQGTQNYISRLVAAKGVNSGMPGSQFNTADLVTSLGLTSEQLVNSGLSAYNSLLSTVGGLQESPELMSNIADRNATLAAAPDPQQASEQLIKDLQNEFGFAGFGGQSPAGYGSTHILGPKAAPPSYGSTTPWWSSGNQFTDTTPVYVGGPGVGASNPTLDQTNNWQDYLRRTFGGADYGYQPAGSQGTGPLGEDPLMSQDLQDLYSDQFMPTQ